MKYGKCFLSGAYGLVERHHIFGGALRGKSELYCLTVDLSPWMHREGPKAAHRCWETRVQLCKYGQKKAMLEQDWSVERWVEEFGRNWLDDWEIEQVYGLQADAKAWEDREAWFREDQPWTEEELRGFEVEKAAEEAWEEEMSEQARRPAGLRFTMTLDVLPF